MILSSKFQRQSLAVSLNRWQIKVQAVARPSGELLREGTVTYQIDLRLPPIMWRRSPTNSPARFANRSILPH